MEAVGGGEGVDTFHVQEPMKMMIVYSTFRLSSRIGG